MQAASRQCMWGPGGGVTEIGIDTTGVAYPVIDLYVGGYAGTNVVIDWGDGMERTRVAATEPALVQHVFMGRKKFTMRVRNLRCVGLRKLDSSAHERSEPLVRSVVDKSGRLTSSMSGAFKYCANLTRFVAPNCAWLGQRDFAGCTSLEEVVLGKAGVCYDGTFEYCTKLAKFSAEAARTCWRYVWRGCSSLAELKLGDVDQLSDDDFAGMPALRDVRISNRTVDQIRQAAPSGNIAGGYGSSFPWGANASCRFHGKDGYVLGDGTVVRT